MQYDIAKYPRDLHVTVDLSHYKDVFLVTDIHDEWEELRFALANAGFDPTCHALVINGDTTDRGPNPYEYKDWLTRPYVYRTLGNHEQFLGSYLDNQVSYEFMQKVGAQWFLNLSPLKQIEAAEFLLNAPVAMTIITPKGRKVGLAHADCMESWDAQTDALSMGNRGRIWVTNLILQSRETIKTLLKAKKEGLRVNPALYQVHGINHVFHGHTILTNHFTVANRTWFDTGMCMGGKFTVIKVDEFLEER